MSRKSGESSEPVTSKQREISFDESLKQVSVTHIPGSCFVKEPTNNCYEHEEIIFDFEDDFYRTSNEDGKNKFDVFVTSSEYEEVYKFIP